jgi:hypothetical protein
MKTVNGLRLERKMEEKYGQWMKGKGKKRKGEKPKKGKWTAGQERKKSRNT